MNTRLLFTSALLVSAAGLMNAQDDQIRATYRGGGDSGEGKCTVDVVVDGAVDLEIRGDTAFLHNLSGEPARARRFVCTQPIPRKMGGFRFDPQEGRGKQTLIHDPRDGGPIVVRIEDPQSGSEGYKFDFYWETSGSRGGYEEPGTANPYGGGYRDQNEYHHDRDGWQRQDWRQRIFERVRMDVEHTEAAYQSADDQRRIGHVEQELNEMQDKLARGRYDKRELDDVIEALQRVLHNNRLSRRDGELLSDDLDRLRDFRQRHDEYGARDPY